MNEATKTLVVERECVIVKILDKMRVDILKEMEIYNEYVNEGNQLRQDIKYESLLLKIGIHLGTPEED